MSNPLGPVIEALSTIIELDPWKETPEMPTTTAKKDPFANAANAEGNGQPAKDPFGQPAGGGGFPKVADLLGCLLLIKPIKVEEVPDYQDRTKMRDQLTADVTVIDGPPAKEFTDRGQTPPDVSAYVGKTYNSMWLNNKTLISAGEAALRDGTPSILGRLWRFPQTSEVKAGKYTDRHDLEAKEAEIQANWRPGMPPPEPPKIAWGLEKYTEEEAQMARDFLAAKRG
jgi:hypothetical protein